MANLRIPAPSQRHRPLSARTSNPARRSPVVRGTQGRSTLSAADERILQARSRYIFMQAGLPRSPTSNTHGQGAEKGASTSPSAHVAAVRRGRRPLGGRQLSRAEQADLVRAFGPAVNDRSRMPMRGRTIFQYLRLAWLPSSARATVSPALSSRGTTPNRRDFTKSSYRDTMMPAPFAGGVCDVCSWRREVALVRAKGEGRCRVWARTSWSRWDMAVWRSAQM